MWEGSDQDGRRFVVAHIEPKHHERFKRDTGFRWLSNDLRNWISRTQSRWNSLRNANQDFRSLDSPQALPQTMYSSSLPLPGSEFGEGDEDRFHDYDGLPNIHNGSHGLMDNPRSNGYSNLVSNFRLDVYHPIDEIYAYFDSVARHPRYGHTVFVKTIGYSHERRPIRSVEVQQDPPNVGKKLVYMDALVHAREWITGASLLHMFEHILVHRVPCNFIFVPVVNPDGYSYTWTNDRLWRKNRRAPSARSSSSRLRPLAMLRNEKCVGVDLNRNFDINFAGEGASSNICSQLYAGDRPFSEPETAALARLVADRRKEIRLLISLHSFNQLWSSPYAYTLYPSPHAELHRKVLKEVQSAVFSVSRLHIFAP